MRCRNWLLTALTVAPFLLGQEPVRKLSDYPAQVKLGGVVLGVEKLGPAIPSPGGAYYADGYLVLEAAFFSEARDQRVAISHSHFSLRINGAKTVVPPDSPGAVAASIKYPDWERRSHLEVGGGVGDGSVVIGRPQPVGRFPGDRRPVDGRVPNPVPPIENPTHGPAEAIPVEEIVDRAALVEGERVLPLWGCLYFPYKGKLKSIRKLELVYAGPLGDAVLLIP